MPHKILKNMKTKKILGIDVGGSGIKGAVVNTKTGEMQSDRYRIETPVGAKPDDVAGIIETICQKFSWEGPIGVGFPAVVQHGVAKTAANIDKSFIGLNVEKLITARTNCPVKVVNDADAAGFAEMKFGAGVDKSGVVVLITVGTGIGTVIFSDGKLLPNTELGHIIMPGDREAEPYACDATRKKLELSWEQWALRFNEYLHYIEDLFWPDLFIIGGGVSKHENKIFSHFDVRTKIVPAQLLNNAGIIGAAIAAKQAFKDID